MGAGGEEEVEKICPQSQPWGGKLFQGPGPARSSPGWFGVPVVSLPSLGSHSVALEVPEAAVEVQEATRCSHTWGDRGAELCWDPWTLLEPPADGA